MLPDMLISLLMLGVISCLNTASADGFNTRLQAFVEHTTYQSLSLEDGSGDTGEGLAGDVLHPAQNLPGARARP